MCVGVCIVCVLECALHVCWSVHCMCVGVCIVCVLECALHVCWSVHCTGKTSIGKSKSGSRVRRHRSSYTVLHPCKPGKATSPVTGHYFGVVGLVVKHAPVFVQF
jgi:hypothetical protein